MATWIFLRGLTRESRHWGDFVGHFQQAMPASWVITLDLPGNGQLNQETSPLGIQDMVAHCRTQLALRQLAPPYHLLAMSLGAMVAVAWAQAYPQELAANVLVNTSMRPFSPFYQRLQPANYGVLLKLLMLGASPEAWERTILRITTHQTSDAVLPVWLALRQGSPVTRANALRQLLAAARFRASVAKPAVRTLLLASEQDHLVSVECTKSMAKIWQCPLKLHPTAGHDLPLDDGPWVARQVQAWERGEFD
jgi:pimeloyl-ACP methyl ester carboxylesterase